MTKVKRFSIAASRLLAASCLLAFLASCANVLNAPAQKADGTGTVQVLINGETPAAQAARTVFPTTSGLHYKYLFAKNGGTPEAKTPGAGGQFVLETGSYTLMVEAYTDAAFTPGNKVGIGPGKVGGASPFPVNAGTNTDPITVALEPLGSGTGTFTYTVTYPNTATLVTLTWTRLDAVETAVDLLDSGTNNVTVTTTTGSTAGTKAQVTAGTYVISALLSDGTGKTTGKEEEVRIYPGLTTVIDAGAPGKEYGFAFADGDFSGFTYYVSAAGSDSDNGYTLGAALATPTEALTKIAARYAADWPAKGNKALEPAAIIIVSGTVTAPAGDIAAATGWLDISGTAYPPIELRGAGTGAALDFAGASGTKTGRILYIANGNKVTLGDNLTLKGGYFTGSGNNGGGVYVTGGSTFILAGGEISDNSSDTGGGIAAYNSSIVTISGGTIKHNSAANGGGVYLSNSEFTLLNGTIIQNTSSGPGGGVYPNSGSKFFMSGGTIGGSAVDKNVAATTGGGVLLGGNTGSAPVVYSRFEMSGGTISYNEAGTIGGGVNISSATADPSYPGFIMSGTAVISNNTAAQRAGGVYTRRPFTMVNGAISGNTAAGSGADQGGGGVFVDLGSSFTMQDGSITGNSATGATSKKGGGVFIQQSNTYLDMQGGTISGNNADIGSGVYV
jgi:hypothetical protein